jgi:hypothetical protein
MPAKRCPRKGCKADMRELRADAVWCSRKCYIAVRRDPRAYRDPTPRPRPSGKQISYRKAVEEVAFYLRRAGALTSLQAHELAEDILRRALPERQR